MSTEREIFERAAFAGALVVLPLARDDILNEAWRKDLYTGIFEEGAELRAAWSIVGLNLGL